MQGEPDPISIDFKSVLQHSGFGTTRLVLFHAKQTTEPFEKRTIKFMLIVGLKSATLVHGSIFCRYILHSVNAVSSEN